MKYCLFNNCNKRHYGKGYCNAHYTQKYIYHIKLKNIRQKNKGKLCKVNDCNGNAVSLLLCQKHYQRYLKNGNVNIFNDLIGQHNPRWNGGISEYPNHYEMKKNRKIKIKQQNGKCEKCGSEGKYIHHKDKSKNNHNLKNLMLLCSKCHGFIHRQKKL